jgi:hypothetical protein
MSSFDNSSPAGQPSTTAPSAVPWLEPKVVILNILPIVFPDMDPHPYKILKIELIKL